jgi:hypothetical protein
MNALIFLFQLCLVMFLRVQKSWATKFGSNLKSGILRHLPHGQQAQQEHHGNGSNNNSNNDNDDNGSIGITSYRNSYDDKSIQQKLTQGKEDEFFFQRYQSPRSIQNALKTKTHLKYHHGKDGRKGYVSTRKLTGDWVLAQSEQVAVQTSTKEVLKAYLNGELQEKWNRKEVIKCHFSCKDIHQKKKNHGKYYQQDLILKSQRIITSQTGIMRYRQTIMIDQIGNEKYCVIIRLDDPETISSSSSSSSSIPVSTATSTKCKPFDSLLVHVGLEQNGEDVNIYANGIMKVNRKVVPNLIVFDASGIAGSMAGKATLWLAAHFEEKRRERKLSRKLLN